MSSWATDVILTKVRISLTRRITIFPLPLNLVVAEEPEVLTELRKALAGVIRDRGSIVSIFLGLDGCTLTIRLRFFERLTGPEQKALFDLIDDHFGTLYNFVSVSHQRSDSPRGFALGRNALVSQYGDSIPVRQTLSR